ncbi:hypothetical protein DV495_003579 [Geotrichum candidum]|uniref:NADH-cytochrome b5 reductase n=1 Tax=Geotrichum candidum TaxID=1173061 RepID=A0A0J9X4V5_GEOCN|nr:hypothetical protein DV454_003696 [Geotrichum candidum]KAF5116313.1 hypothetical protein DV452_002691 [Geotrichum candidum]KAF5124978.1 hypothetical protein DV495_003579 [Geotrichum candidum]KAF7499140.1 hypothetical protein DV113_002830 [Geotrichum candidum]CDO52159.1 similar to Saccharomyces cerevisiae YKL150W MCR1 Mitochondrial NADH-cytochrome b5 reductase [Geotrichum candidum]
MSFAANALKSFRAVSKISANRAYSSVASGAVKTNPAYIAGAAAVAGVAGFCMYSSLANSKVALESTLKGDNAWVDLKLSKIETLSSNTKEFTFELPKDETLGLTYTSCLLAKYVTPKGSNVIRPYTPISDLDTPGTFTVLIKRYETGKFGNHIFGLNVNDTVSFKGPIPKYPYTANKHNEIGLIGGGTGIAPLFQLIRAVSKNPADKTKVSLFYGNVSEDDILLKKELEEIQSKNPEQFKFHFFVDKAGSDWKGQTGFITKDYLKENLFPSSADNVHVFVCGPPPLYNAISGNKVSPTDQGEVTGALAELGFTKEQVFKF